MSDASFSRSFAADPVIARSVAFLERVFPAPRRFGIRLWDGTILPAEGSPPFTLVLNGRGSIRRMFQPPVELSMGEAYLRGDFDIQGDLAAAFDLVPSARFAFSSPGAVGSLLAAWLALPSDAPPEEAAKPVHTGARLSGEEHSRTHERAATQYHYDVGNDFYKLFLDRRMIYTCAYFPTGEEDIDTAQEAKLELICRKLRLQPGERLLDVGCGWGGFLIYAAQRYGIHGLGVTLSTEQYNLARERVAEAGLEGQLRIEPIDYRDLKAGPFDKIVSIGMFEQVGRVGLPEYFGKLFDLLKPGGLFLNHGIANRPSPAGEGTLARVRGALDHLLVGKHAFRRRYIFPSGELVPVSEVNMMAEQAGFEVCDIENLREHYSLTLQHWINRLRERREAAVANAGEAIYRLWDLYLAASKYHFDTARFTLNQTLLCKSPVGSTYSIPRSREEIYTEPIAAGG